MLKGYSRIRLLLEASHNTKRMLALVFACTLVISSGGGGCSDDKAGGESTTSPSGASLNVTKTEHAGRFKLDAGASVIPQAYQVEQVTFEITDTNSGELIAQKQVPHHSEPAFHYLPAGTYFVELLIDVTATESSESEPATRIQSQTSETLSDGVYVETEDSYTQAELDDDGDCLLICSKYDSDNSKVGCTFDFDSDSCTDMYTLSVEDLLETAQFENDDIVESDDLCIRATGAAGTSGDDTKILWTWWSGGSAGEGGIAQTITTYSDLSSQYTDLYFLLGHKGSSTVVAGVDFSSGTDIDVSGVIVAAGGGGGGGDSDWLNLQDGADGGDGAMVSSETEGEYVFGAGGTGDYVVNDYNAGAGGGTDATTDSCDDMTTCISTYAVGGDESDLAGDDGSDGLGGLAHSQEWYNASDFSDDYGGDGDGGEGQTYLGISGGDGGGGVGGGQGGNSADGAGGGGSFASEATYTSSWCNDDYYTTNSSSYGNVTFIFSFSTSTD